MQVEVSRHPLERPHPLDAVSVRIQPRGEHPESDLGGQRTEDATRHPALGRDADRGHPVAGRVVHSARGHDRQHMPRHLVRDHPFLGHRIDPAGGQGHRHHRQVADGHRVGALPGVSADRLVRVAVNDPSGPHQIGHRPVAERGTQLGVQNRDIHVQRATRERREPLLHGRVPLDLGRVRRPDEGVRGDGSDVDHRVLRASGFRLERDLVERITGRLHADLLQHTLDTPVAQGEGVDERLAHRLDGELGVRIAGGVDDAVQGAGGDSEPVRIDGGELGDVVGQLAVIAD